ncbi:MAG: hypothetical protein JWM05_3679 [Acidimicrobiales bacterium]|nr:hypothetical protein [Acidimicrobiales bacterium]
MAANRTSFEKLQRDRAKKAKAALKREKRQLKGEEGPEGTEETATTPEWLNLPPGEAPSAANLLEMVATLHQQFENEEISFDEFEERKTELFASLSVD